MAHEFSELRGLHKVGGVRTPPTRRNRAEPKVIFGYDRITLWLDNPEPPIAVDELKRHCTDLTATVAQMPFNARWKIILEIFQPTLTCLRLLEEALGRNISVQITYVEIACDTLADNKRQARQFRDAFLAAARVRYQRQSFKPWKASWYCGERADRAVWSAYADRPSKLNNARPAPETPPCSHIEYRARGAATLERLNILSVADLVQFNHQEFWNQHIRVYQLPKLTQLGRLLAQAGGADTDVSGSALRKRAARWLARHGTEDKFVMHNALQATPELARHLKTQPFLDWLRSTVIAERED